MKKLFLLFLNITTLSFASHITNIEAISEVLGMEKNYHLLFLLMIKP